MHDFTNLAWPEAPFGADQRPFGKRCAILAALAFDWAPASDGEPVPAAVATVYLRIRRDGTTLEVTDETLAIGFRVTTIESLAEVQALLQLTDRAVTRARRHAAVLAGHRFEDELAQLAALSSDSLRGIAGVRSEWPGRSAKVGGIAQMVDTGFEAADAPGALHIPLLGDAGEGGDASQNAMAPVHSTLTRCLAVGMAAAAHLARYRWDGTFRTGHAIERAGWDVLPGRLPKEPTAGDPCHSGAVALRG